MNKSPVWLEILSRNGKLIISHSQNQPECTSIHERGGTMSLNNNEGWFAIIPISNGITCGRKSPQPETQRRWYKLNTHINKTRKTFGGDFGIATETTLYFSNFTIFSPTKIPMLRRFPLYSAIFHYGYVMVCQVMKVELTHWYNGVYTSAFVL